MVLLLGSSCKYRLSLGERCDCTGTIINQLLADSYKNPPSEWLVTIKLHLVSGYKSESDTYFNLRMACPLFYLPLLSASFSRTAHLSQSQFWGAHMLTLACDE